MNKKFFKEPGFICHAIGFACLFLATILSVFSGNCSGFWGNFAALCWCTSSCTWYYFATNK